MIAQVVIVSQETKKEPSFVGSLAQGFVLGVKIARPDVRRYLEVLPFVMAEWPDQVDCRERLEVALAELGSTASVVEPCEGEIAQGLVLGVLRANPEKVVPFPALVTFAKQYIWWEDPTAGLEKATRALYLLGLVSIESMSSPSEQWRLWRRDRPETA